MMPVLRAALCAVALTSFIEPLPLLAHEGHDHGAQVPAPIANLVPRGEAASETYEVVAVARGGALAVYVDRFSTNEPVDDATVEIETPVGPATATGKPGEPYRLAAPWSSKPGSYDLIFTVTKAGSADVLPLTLVVPTNEPGSASIAAPNNSGGDHEHRRNLPTVLIVGLGGFAAGVGLMVLIGRRRQTAMLILVCAFLALSGTARAHDGHDHADPAPPISTTRDVAQRLPEGAVFVPKNTQRILAIRTFSIESAVHHRTVELPGRVIPDPNASGFVQASVGGRLSPPQGGFPRLGTPVKKGDVLAYVEPSIQAIDASDMRQRQGELDQQISIVERRLARYETLAPGGAIARSQLEDTRSELQGLVDRRNSLDKSRRAPEELTAPVDGVIAEGTPVAGQIAQSNAVIFHIVDPARLWVEARSFDALSGIRSASARSSKDVTLELSYRGSGFADRNQSIPVQFAVQGDAGGLRAGQFVTVLASTDEEKTGFAIPRSSLVRNANGQDVVYEHVTAERFKQHAVRVEPLDGERVLIASGLSGGERIVVQGAELLEQVR